MIRKYFFVLFISASTFINMICNFLLRLEFDFYRLFNIQHISFQ